MVNTLNEFWPQTQIHTRLFSKVHFDTALEKSRSLYSIDYCPHGPGDADDFTQHVRMLLTGHRTTRKLRLAFNYRHPMRTGPLPFFKFRENERLAPLEELILDGYPFHSHWAVAFDPSNLTSLHIRECDRDLDFLRVLNGRIPLLRFFSWSRWWSPHFISTKEDVTSTIIELLSGVGHLISLSLEGDYCAISLDVIPSLCPHLVYLYLHSTPIPMSVERDKYTAQEIGVLVESLHDLELFSLDSNIEISLRQLEEDKLSDEDHEFLKALAAAPKLQHIALYDNARHIDQGPSSSLIRTFREAIGKSICEYLQSVKVGLPLRRLDMDSGWWCEKDPFVGWGNRPEGPRVPATDTSRNTHQRVLHGDGSLEYVSSWVKHRENDVSSRFLIRSDVR